MKDINLFRSEDSIYLKKVRVKADLSGDCDGYLIEGGEKEARKIIASLKDSTRNGVPSKMGTGVPSSSGARNGVPSKLGTGVPSSSGKDKKLIGLIGGGDAFNRRAVETLKIDYLVSPERGDKRDSLKQRDSGINHVVAKMAKDKGIVIVVDMGEVSGLGGKAKALRIERIIQNVKICRKAFCGIKIASLASDKSGLIDEKGRMSIGVSFGMSSGQASKAIVF